MKIEQNNVIVHNTRMYIKYNLNINKRMGTFVDLFYFLFKYGSKRV